jgi:hypothetical protein
MTLKVKQPILQKGMIIIMRNRIQSVALIGLLVLAGCSTIHEVDISHFKVIPVAAVNSDPARWQEVMRDIQNGKEVILFFRNGQSIPLKVSLEHPLVKLEAGKNRLIFTHNAYLLISLTKVEISPDGKRWVNIRDLKSQKELFGIDSGAFSIAFGVSPEEGTQIAVDITAK